MGMDTDKFRSIITFSYGMYGFGKIVVSHLSIAMDFIKFVDVCELRSK